MKPNDRKITEDSYSLKMDSCPGHQQEEVTFADKPLIKKEPTKRIGVRLNIDPSEYETFDNNLDNKIAQLAQETIEKIRAIKNDSRKNKQMSYRGYQNYEVYMRTVWPEARVSIYTDGEGQIIAPLNSFVSIEREDSTMWSRAFEIEIKAMYSKGHIRREVAGHILRHRTTVSEAFLRVAEII